MGTNDRPVQFAGGILGRRRHVCAFFSSIDEEHRVLHSFIKMALTAENELSTSWTRPPGRPSEATRGGRHRCRAGLGFGQLEVRPWQDALPPRKPIRSGRHAGFIEDVLQSAAGRRIPAHALLAHMAGRYYRQTRGG